MINSFLYCIDKMNFSGSPKGTPHDLWKKIILKWWINFCKNWVSFLYCSNPGCLKFLKKWIFQAHRRVPPHDWCRILHSEMVFLKKMRLFAMKTNGNWVDVWSSSTRTFQQKKQVPRNDQFLLILYWQNEFFRLTEGYPPRFYVCSSAKNWVSFMYKGLTSNSLWGVATLDVWFLIYVSPFGE